MRPPLRTDIVSVVAIGAGTLASFALGGVLFARAHHGPDRFRTIDVERAVHEAEMEQFVGPFGQLHVHPSGEHMEEVHVHPLGEQIDIGDLTVHRDASGLYVEHAHGGDVHRHYVGEAESSSDVEVIVSAAKGDHQSGEVSKRVVVRSKPRR